MKNLLITLALLMLVSFDSLNGDPIKEEQIVNATLDAWHKAAGEAHYAAYFDMMTNDAVFIGTDANEYWRKEEFKEFSRPYFDKGKAWNFTPVERHVFFDKTFETAWFDELLSTQMKICRGSGVLVKIDGRWKIKHYVLSMTIPNDVSGPIIKLKTPIEDSIINKFQLKK
ncbi:nuclear transport factor 2 family protein [Flavobacterium sp. FlaQc-57]|uniref:nuclear transport factor 2 family protein n=1 Tax=Flavobacterium sp. FlaQc-57 TaxID=3374186 RepID=UPI003758084D